MQAQAGVNAGIARQQVDQAETAQRTAEAATAAARRQAEQAQAQAAAARCEAEQAQRQADAGAIDAAADAARWRAEAAGAARGLRGHIDRQFALWKLSPAEQEIALLLLKGLSLQEVADVRGTSERTVRQQAAAVYQKAAVANRAELSAWFLEDLLDF